AAPVISATRFVRSKSRRGSAGTGIIAPSRRPDLVWILAIRGFVTLAGASGHDGPRSDCADTGAPLFGGPAPGARYTTSRTDRATQPPIRGCAARRSLTSS